MFFMFPNKHGNMTITGIINAVYYATYVVNKHEYVNVRDKLFRELKLKLKLNANL